MSARVQGHAAYGDERPVRIPVGVVALDGILAIPATAGAIVLFAHGSGSGRDSPRNRLVAHELRQAGLATLLMDLLTRHEEQTDDVTGRLRFDIPFLADRLVGATDWLLAHPETRGLRIGYFGASTGAAAALVAAAQRSAAVGAIVSRGGRPDLARAVLTRRSMRPPCSSSASETRRCSRGTRRHCANSVQRKTWRSFPARHTCSRNRARSRRWRGWQAPGSSVI
jgi:putative phosphoribosyl transferase